MLTVVIGFASNSIKSTPTVIYCGYDGDAAQTAINTAFATYPRIYKYPLLDKGIPVQDKSLPPPPPEPPGEETQSAKAETKAQKAEAKQAEHETKHPHHETTRYPKK
jgi:hypothetical protein